MKTIKILGILTYTLYLFSGCKQVKNTNTSFANNADNVNKLAVMFDITHDNTGVVTITPSGNSVASYEISLGDTSQLPITVFPGGSIKHTYAEGVYTVKVIGKSLNGISTTITEPLTVSYFAPQNLKVEINTVNLSVNITSKATFETFFKVFYGDSDNVSPIPFSTVLDGKTITHTYSQSGTYIVKVIAISGGSETTQFLDTINVAKQLDLPLTFEDPNVSYVFSDFGRNQTSLGVDPKDPTNKVAKSIKTNGAETYAGVTIGNIGFANPIHIAPGQTKISLRLYSPFINKDIKLKLSLHGSSSSTVETDVFTTKANEWETLVFDFVNNSSGTPSVNYKNTYNEATLFYDFNIPGSGTTFYWDDVQLLPLSLIQIGLPVTFDDPTIDYTVTDFGNLQSALSSDPLNANNKVMKSIKPNGAATYAGTTIGTSSGFSDPIPITSKFSKMYVRVYSPDIGIDIKLKLEERGNSNHSVETDVKTTVKNGWENLVFDFNNNTGSLAIDPSFVYDKASIFFDFGNDGVVGGKVFYWDDVHFL